MRDHIAQWAVEPPVTLLQVVAVQPGLRIDRITDQAAINTLLVSSYGWAVDQGVSLLVAGA